MSVVGVLIVYGNLAVILHPPKIGLVSVPGLPRPHLVHDAFLMTGMFTSFTSDNFELFLEGAVEADGADARWMPLSLSDHFPHRYGVTYSTLVAAHHLDLGGQSAQRDAWRDVARRIRSRHNHLHQTQPVVRVRFGVRTWPRSPAGYREGRESAQGRRRVWFTEVDGDRENMG